MSPLCSGPGRSQNTEELDMVAVYQDYAPDKIYTWETMK